MKTQPDRAITGIFYFKNQSPLDVEKMPQTYSVGEAARSKHLLGYFYFRRKNGQVI